MEPISVLYKLISQNVLESKFAENTKKWSSVMEKDFIAYK